MCIPRLVMSLKGKVVDLSPDSYREREADLFFKAKPYEEY